MDLVHDAGALVDRLAGVDGVALALAAGFHLARRGARARAWQNVVQAAAPGSRLSYPAALGACLAALGIASLSPIRGGELTRALLVANRVRSTSRITLAATMAVESVVDVAIGACFCVAALIAGVPPDAAGLTIVAAGRERLVVVLHSVRAGLSVVGNRRGFASGVASWIGASWILRLASLYCFLEAFSIDASLGLVVVVVGIQCLSGLIPATLIGAGAQQGLLVLALSDATGTSAAAAFALGSQAVTLVCNVAAGAIALLLLTRGTRRRASDIVFRCAG